MGPTLIFDKSFLQSISIDESVFLEHFFITNVTPLFYVETLGDLDLGEHKSGKSIIEVISELSFKVPSTGAAPNVHHSRLIAGNLSGIEVEMDGRIIREGGVEKVDPDGNVGIHFQESSEEIALRRWHNHEYSDIERLFSKSWRNSLSNITFNKPLSIVKNLILPETKLSNYVQIKEFIDNYIKNEKTELLLYLVAEFTGMPQQYYQKALKRWNSNQFTNFEEFAPYVAYILKINLFFYISMLKGIESKERPSHVIDLAYLYYLPFCNVFVSNDNLHKRMAPWFIRQDQIFVKGDDLKSGLRILNDYYSKYIDQIREEGLIRFASQPPKDCDNIISDIWDKIFPNWRKSQKNSKEFDDKEEKKLLEHLKRIEKESVCVSRKTEMDKVHHVIFTHKVPVQKGKWRILPKGIENKEKKVDI